MLTDTTLRNSKPRPAPYKVSDREGMYVLVTTTGCISFRYDYRLNERRKPTSSAGTTLGGWPWRWRAKNFWRLARRSVEASLPPRPRKSRDEDSHRPKHSASTPRIGFGKRSLRTVRRPCGVRSTTAISTRGSKGEPCTRFQRTISDHSATASRLATPPRPRCTCATS